MTTARDTQTAALRKREENLFSDGQWRSFPKIPHLLQYVSNGKYYGRIKANGKVIRESLKTIVWTTAKLRLKDFLKTHQEGAVGCLVRPRVRIAWKSAAKGAHFICLVRLTNKFCFIP